MKCTEFFDQHLSLRLLAEACEISNVNVDMRPPRCIVTLRCIHGATHTHTCYPGSMDWWVAASLQRRRAS